MKRTEELGIDNLKLIQDTDLFCFGTDSVLLSDFVRIPSGGKVLDLCTGNGIIPVLLCAKTKAKTITGIEILKESYDIACENVEINNLQDRLTFINGDLKNWKDYFKAGEFDAVTCNPPYMKPKDGFVSPSDLKAAARHEIFASLCDVAEVASQVLKFGGHLFMVHRADRLCDVLCAMRNVSIEPKRLQFVHANPYKEASLILVEGIKGAHPSLKMEKPIYVNTKD